MDKNYDKLEVIIKEEAELSLDSENSQSPSIITYTVENKLPDISKKCGEIFLQELETFVIVCSYCNTMYSSYEDFIFHLRTQHDEILKLNQYFDRNDALDFKTNQNSDETDEHIDYKQTIDFVDAENVESIILTSNQDITIDSLNNEQEPIREKKKRIRSYPCDICCIKFRTKKALNEHQAQNHSQEHMKDESEDGINENSNLKTEELPNNKRKRKFLCDICQMVFKTKKSLNEHTEIKHQDVHNLNPEQNDSDKELDVDEDKSNTISFDTKSSLPNSYKCNSCNKTFKSKYYLKYHIRCHNSDPLPCKICGREFFSKRNMKRHELLHEVKSIQKPFKCTLCDKTYTKDHSLQRHLLYSHKSFEEHPYKCERCNKTYSSQYLLQGHIRWHNNDPLPCRICGKEFYMNKNRKRHELLHKERQILCTTCGKKFNNTDNLRDHMMRHEGIKPHKCEYCTMSFVSSSGLNEHRRKHTGEKPYECDICGGRFGIASSLKKHKKLHSDVAEYKCKICEKSFKQYAGLYMHLKTHRIDN